MVKETIYELKKDLSQIRKYIKYGIFFLLMAGTLVLYNQYYFKVEREIMSLSQMKSQLSAKNLMLKKEVSRLSSPEKIEKVATEKLKMKPVDYSKVRFIEIK